MSNKSCTQVYSIHKIGHEILDIRYLIRWAGVSGPSADATHGQSTQEQLNCQSINHTILISGAYSVGGGKKEGNLAKYDILYPGFPLAACHSYSYSPPLIWYALK